MVILLLFIKDSKSLMIIITKARFVGIERRGISIFIGRALEGKQLFDIVQ